jgi:hypothetical protein
MPSNNDIRGTMLTVIQEQTHRTPNGDMQSGSVLHEVARRLKFAHDNAKEQAILTQFHELFRTGYIAWGYNIGNPNPPFFHLTEQGRRTLDQLSRDPGNPTGYLNHLDSKGTMNAVARSYIEEAVHCYVAGLYKSSAVMVGGAAESIILELCDELKAKLSAIGRNISSDLGGRQIKRVLNGLKKVFDDEKKNFDHNLRDEYESYWHAFTQQIRASRNEAGHPSSVDPITTETIHASLLIFPELLRLATTLRNWVRDSLL